MHPARFAEAATQRNALRRSGVKFLHQTLQVPHRRAIENQIGGQCGNQTPDSPKGVHARPRTVDFVWFRARRISVDLRGQYYNKHYTMAFLFRRTHSRYWHAGFIDKNGKRRNASTGVTGAKEAQKIANAYEDAANKRRTAKQVRDVISELHKEITGEDLASQSFKAFSETWPTRKEPEVAPATLVFYKNALGKFSVFLGEKANEEMTAITQDDITCFRNQEAKTLSSKTVNHDHTAVSMMKDAGVPEAAVMELVGHDSEQMSAHYTHVGTEALKKASASLPVL